MSMHKVEYAGGGVSVIISLTFILIYDIIIIVNKKGENNIELER